ncbi:MAG: hypothetical protein KAS23_09845 [Anaerohalosphaera sp.]|nr:hypothetical protein [Anaerohalosphaera sp.]
MKRFLIIIAVVLFCVLAGNGEAGVSDHVSFVEITQGIEYGESSDPSDVEYCFDLCFFTDASVSGVEFLTPGGQTFVIPDELGNWDNETRTWTSHEFDEDEGAWEWCFERDFDDASGFAAFGDGMYRITVFYEGGGWEQTLIWFGVPGSTEFLDQPTQVPVPLFPERYTGVTSPVTISWEPCEDANAMGVWVWVEDAETWEGIDVGSLLSVDTVSWGPHSLSDGLYEAAVIFANAYQGEINADGIEYLVVKYAETEWDFAVGMDWVAFEVWGGNTDYTSYDQWWEYYQNPGLMTDYVLLGQTDGENLEVCGEYQYYVIRTFEDVGIDSVMGSDGSYLGQWYRTGNMSNPHLGLGAPDGEETVVMRDWALLTNPGDWSCLTVITDMEAICPTADLTGDCYVDFEDLAFLAAQWLTGAKI